MITAGDARSRLRPATEADLAEMASIHKASYGPGHFLALLPAATIASYYRLFLGDGSQIIVAEVESPSGAASLAGFAVFGGNIEPRIGIFKQQQRAAILRTALAHPLVSARKVALGLLGGSGPSMPHDPAPWLLLSIAVRGARRGTGSVLLQEMLRRAALNGQDRFGLYVRHSNVGAINAYLRVGFRIVASLADQYYMEIALRPLASSDTA
jgi:ribosomal protein S18 acetylase RimI-like enzyme